MTVTLEDLCQLMHDTYETAAVRRGWFSHSHVIMSWASVPGENRAAMRDAMAVVEEVIREDERGKNSPEAIQSDLRQIMEVLGISTHARSYSTHMVVQKEIIPKINRMKTTLFEVRAILGKHYVEAKQILDEGRKLE